ncbi:MAG: DUF4271 domain-containing protein [Alistipes sp.]|nr:DUF4271 domain-containing protein [Alistipes sp.]
MNNSTLSYYSANGYRIVRPEAIYGRGSHLASGEALYEGGYQATTIADMYGAESQLVAYDTAELFVPQLSHAPLFHLLLFATLVIYLNMVYRSYGFVRNIYRDLFTMRNERNMIYQGGLLPLQYFKQVASSIGFVVLSLAILRFAEGFIPANSPIYNSSIGGYASIGAIAMVLVYIAWYYAIHKVIEWVTRSDVAPTLSAMGYMHFVRLSIILYPLVAVWLLGIEEGEGFVIPLLIFMAALMVILYLKETILFFIDKKISILYWILYLCTAFLLPLSFVAHLLPERLG